MLTLGPTVRIFVCCQPADMRRSFDGLMRMAKEVVAEDPLSGHLFVFRNRRGDRLKILYQFYYLPCVLLILTHVDRGALCRIMSYYNWCFSVRVFVKNYKSCIIGGKPWP